MGEEQGDTPNTAGAPIDSHAAGVFFRDRHDEVSVKDQNAPETRAYVFQAYRC